MFSFVFFFNATASTQFYTLSLHDALPISVSAEVPQFRERLLRGSERGNVLDQAQEYRQLLGAAWVLVTDEHGILIARTDYPTEADIDLSRGALVANALSGEQTNGAWLDDRQRR